jgi:hypothetical protein
MHEFLVQTKGIEYGISVVFLLGYTAYWAFFKERPFAELKSTVRDDVDYMKKKGSWRTLKMIGKVVGAPLMGLAYIVGLPFIFLFSLVYFGGKALFGARPE